MIELLTDLGIYNDINGELELILATTEETAARQSFIDLMKDPPEQRADLLHGWAQAAGSGCPPEDFKQFLAQISDDACRQEATFGHSLAILESSPELAVTLALHQLATKTESLNQYNILQKLMSRLPPYVNFDEVEEALSASTPAVGREAIKQSLPTFFQKWAESSPDAAAKHIIENQERLSPNLIDPVALVVVVKDGPAGLEWVQDLPDGPHFDSAAVVAINYLRVDHPKEARQLAALIGDHEARQRALARAAAPYEEPRE